MRAKRCDSVSDKKSINSRVYFSDAQEREFPQPSSPPLSHPFPPSRPPSSLLFFLLVLCSCVVWNDLLLHPLAARLTLNLPPASPRAGRTEMPSVNLYVVQKKSEFWNSRMFQRPIPPPAAPARRERFDTFLPDRLSWFNLPPHDSSCSFRPSATCLSAETQLRRPFLLKAFSAFPSLALLRPHPNRLSVRRTLEQFYLESSAGASQCLRTRHLLCGTHVLEPRVGQRGQSAIRMSDLRQFRSHGKTEKKMTD